jgi:hypothetical protein
MKYGLAIVLLFLGVGIAAADSLGASAASAISAYRRQHGLSGVTVSGSLTHIASQQAHAMARAGVLSHTVGGSFQSRVSAAGIGLAAENIAYGVRDLNSALDMWKRSAGHRANMLKGGITQIGIASAQANTGRVYWALVLAGSPEPRGLRIKHSRMQRAAATTTRRGPRDMIKYCGESPRGMPRIACE